MSVVKEADGTLTYNTTAGTFKGFDCLLWAVGRHPLTKSLGLEHVVSLKKNLGGGGGGGSFTKT